MQNMMLSVAVTQPKQRRFLPHVRKKSLKKTALTYAE